MTDRRKRLERALHGLAEAGVPETVDLWPAINERVTGRRPSEARASEEPTGATTRQRVRPSRLAPDSLFGWALAAFSVLILGAGVYAASGSVGELFRQGLPGTVAPASDGDAGRQPSTQPDDNLGALRTEINQTKTQDGARLTLDWAYADERFVAVGLRTQNLDDPAIVYEPALYDDTVGNEAEFPPYVRITDGSGQDFDTVGGGTLIGPDRTGADATFDAPEGIERDREHRFRLEVPLQEEPRVGVKASGKPEPFVFDFEIPVRPAPSIELNQRVEVEGVAMTLRRVVASPVVPQAVVCFEPPDDEHTWTPWLEDDGSYAKVGAAPQKLEDGCWSLTMDRAVEGRSSVTIANLEGWPRGGPPAGTTTFNPKTIRGPWTFEFEAPGS